MNEGLRTPRGAKKALLSTGAQIRDSLLALIGSWRRPCFICTSTYQCCHREPELIERWEKGGIR